MSSETPSIEFVEVQDDIPFIDGISNSTSFVINEETENCHDDYNKEKYRLINTIEEFEDLLRRHEVEQYTKYVTIKTNGYFKGHGKDPASKPRIHWGILSKVSPELATTPYLIVGSRYYVCHLGKCYFANKLRGNLGSGENETKKRYKKVTDSKKVGCPANFKVQRLILFPDNKLSLDTKSERARMGEFIRKNITSVRLDHKYLFKLPDFSDHLNHKDQRAAAEKEPIDKKVANKIKEAVYEGVTNVNIIAEMLDEFVETHIKVNDKYRRRFNPSKVDIQRAIYKAKLSLRKCKNDGSKLEDLRAAFGDSNEVYFHPSNYESQNFGRAKFSGESSSGSRKCGLLFVYQNKEMRRLYNLYGHNCILLDPTYKFCKYSFPLYFVSVQTNVGYQVVGIILTELETKDAIIEGLTVIFHWNPSVIPRYAMTDNNIDEIKAVESLFPEVKVFIPQFYCEMSWEERLQRKDMLLYKEEAMKKLRSIANDVAEDKVQKSINELKCWHSSLLKEYFEKYWQKELKKWTICYRPSDLLFEANEAVDRLYDEFSYLSLSKQINLSLSEMLLYLCQQFIPGTLQKHQALNLSILQKQLETKLYIPSYLSQSPQWFLDFISTQIMSANESLPYSYVECVSEGNFSLLSKTTNEKFNINFSIEQKQVSCTCFCFLKRRIICEHVIIVGRFYPTWNLEKIGVWLFDNSIYKFDNFFSESLLLNQSQEENCYKTELNKNIIEVICKEKSSQMSNNVNEFSSSNTLKEDCKNKLIFLNSLVNKFNANELKDFNESLKLFCATWSSGNRDELSVNSSNGDDNAIPFPMLRKIKDFYRNVKNKSSPNVKRRRGRRKKRPRMVGPKKEKISIQNEDDELEMSSITTLYYENDFNCLEAKPLKNEHIEIEIHNPDSINFD